MTLSFSKGLTLSVNQSKTTALKIITALLGNFALWLPVSAFGSTQAIPLETLSINTLALICMVIFGIVLLGCGLAWLNMCYQFPGRKQISRLLLLPLAIPTYIFAFLLIDFSSEVMPLSQIVLDNMTLEDRLLALVKTSLLFTASLFPLVYLPARAAFRQLSPAQLETRYTLSLSQADTFFHVLLPKAKPGIIAGILLASLIILSDFATPAMSGLPTLSSSIYFAWENHPDISRVWPALTALTLLSIALFLVLRWLRDQSVFTETDKSVYQPAQLKGFAGIAANLSCMSILVLTLVIPGIQLFVWLKESVDSGELFFFVPWMALSAYLSLGTALLSISIALLMMLVVRTGRLPNFLTSFVEMLIAIPILFLAIVTVTLFSGLPSLMAVYLAHTLPLNMRLLRTGILPRSPDLARICNDLGLPATRKLYRVYLPAMRGDIGTGIILSAIIIFKELPGSYFLLPDDWQTLAVACFKQLAKGEFASAGPAAGVLILAGLIPVVLLTQKPSTLPRSI